MARGFSFAPGASPEVIEALSPDLDKPRLVALGSSKNASVRHAIAGRPDCPLGLMVSLAHDNSAEVRAAVAANPFAQSSVLAQLATDREPDVVLAAAANPAAGDELLQGLMGHRRSEVRAAAATRLARGGGAAIAHAEDEHTPELADDVRLGAAAIDEPGMAVPTLEPPAVVVPFADARPAPAPPPPPPQEDALRTGPVRGFLPPTA